MPPICFRAAESTPAAVRQPCRKPGVPLHPQEHCAAPQSSAAAARLSRKSRAKRRLVRRRSAQGSARIGTRVFFGKDGEHTAKEKSAPFPSRRTPAETRPSPPCTAVSHVSLRPLAAHPAVQPTAVQPQTQPFVQPARPQVQSLCACHRTDGKTAATLESAACTADETFVWD